MSERSKIKDFFKNLFSTEDKWWIITTNDAFSLLNEDVPSNHFMVKSFFKPSEGVYFIDKKIISGPFSKEEALSELKRLTKS